MTRPKCCLLSLFAFFIATQVWGDDASFREVAKILAQNCVRCHNDIDREGDFSLETSDSIRESGFVEPGDVSSHLLQVISAQDGEPATMPKQADPLTGAEVETIVSWIKSGAEWPDGVRIEEKVSDLDWWSFQPIRRPAVPVTDDEWGRTPIDAFVLAKLHEIGLTHSDQADRRTLIRRLHFDLIGLPPTPEEVESFVGDEDPRAYEKLVDRLLESKHYGERWARHWLDVVKYADTCGYDKDKLRVNAWPYRDYVIRSFNEDKPYARFIQEQIAGDVLFPGESDGILGLGFIAAGPWDFIGHVEVPESKIDGKVARNLDRDEMVSNTLNTFCSVTIQCARCHNHKFDPFTQEHYYGLQAIFAAVDRAERPYDLDPEVEDRKKELEVEIAAARQKVQAIDKAITDDGGPRLAELRKQVGDLRERQTVKKEPAFGYHSAISKNADDAKWVEVDLGREELVSKIILRPCHDEFQNIGAGFGFPVRFRIDVSTDEFASAPNESDGSVYTVHDSTNVDIPNPGLEPIVLTDVGRRVRFVRVTATKLAARSNDFIFALAEMEVIDESGENIALHAKVHSIDSIEAPVRWARTNLTDGHYAKAGDPTASRELADREKELGLIIARVETEQRKTQRRELQGQITDSEKELRSFPSGKMVYAAATDFKPQGNFKPTGGKLRPVHLLHRGNVQQPLQEVQPTLLQLDDRHDGKMSPQTSESQRRAQLARSLSDKEHPLVWRSIVNRVWQYHFGAGLVETPNDFGRMGARPTHPKLLDWLACEFRDGQSFKQLHRLIVTSSVYRQSSRFHKGNAAIDGGNRYLWRMSRRRLEAEEIRDSVLAVSGQLDETMGGPGFYLFKLERAEHSPHYEYHKFDPAEKSSHRRTVYRFVVRSQPDPFMTTLDCADSSQSTPRRNETLTSLQALSLMNNRFNLEMAARFADRLRRDAEDLESQIDHAMMLVVGRHPTDEETEELASYQRQHGLANMCRMMLNFSEFLFLD